MPDRKTETIQLKNGFHRKTALSISVDVPGNRRDRSDRFELFNDRSCTDIAGMDDVVNVLEMSQDRVIKQTMSIRDDADTKGPAAIHGRVPA